MKHAIITTDYVCLPFLIHAENDTNVNENIELKLLKSNKPNLADHDYFSYRLDYSHDHRAHRDLVHLFCPGDRRHRVDPDRRGDLGAHQDPVNQVRLLVLNTCIRFSSKGSITSTQIGDRKQYFESGHILLNELKTLRQS